MVKAVGKARYYHGSTNDKLTSLLPGAKTGLNEKRNLIYLTDDAETAIPYTKNRGMDGSGQGVLTSSKTGRVYEVQVEGKTIGAYDFEGLAKLKSAPGFDRLSGKTKNSITNDTGLSAEVLENNAELRNFLTQNDYTNVRAHLPNGTGKSNQIIVLDPSKAKLSQIPGGKPLDFNPSGSGGAGRAIKTLTAGDDGLPVRATKGPNVVQRAAGSITHNLERMGISGTKIAKRLDEAEYTAETLQGKILTSAPTVGKLKGKTFTEFVDALEMLRKGETPQMSPKVAQAVEEWTQVAPKIRQAALKTGVDVGDLGPYYFPKTYDNLFKDTSAYNRAVKHLVDTGQAKDEAQAIGQLNYLNRVRSGKYGHLEMQRVVDLPEFDKSPGALTSYIQQAAERIGHAQQFGAKDEIANQLIEGVAREGGDAAKAQDYFNIAAGRKVYSQEKEQASNIVRQFMAIKSLGTAAISNVNQTTNTATVTGILNTVKGITRGLSKEGREAALRSGVIADAVLKDIRNNSGITKGLASKIAAPVFQRVESFNRAVAYSSGRVWAQRLAHKAANGDKKSMKILTDKLGIKNFNGTLDEKQLERAGREVVKITQFKIGAKDLTAWAASPEGKLVAQLRIFAYKQSEFMYNEVVKPLAKGDVKPLARFMAVGIPLGYATGKVRDKIKGYGEEHPAATNNPSDAFENTGAFGLAGSGKFLYETRNSAKLPSYITSTLLGPAAGFGVETATNVSNAVKGNPTELYRQGLKAIPVLGPRVQQAVLPYKKKKKSSRSSGRSSGRK